MANLFDVSGHLINLHHSHIDLHFSRSFNKLLLSVSKMMRVGTTAKMMAFVTRAPYNGNTAALVRYRTGLRLMSAAPPSAKVCISYVCNLF